MDTGDRTDLTSITAHGTNEHVTEVVRQAHEELRQLLQRRREIVQRIAIIKQAIASLTKLCEDPIVGSEEAAVSPKARVPGLTVMCRMILMKASVPMGARDICDQLQATTPTMLEHHTNPLASVTVVLHRLEKYGEVRALIENGKREWQWIAKSQQSCL